MAARSGTRALRDAVDSVLSRICKGSGPAMVEALPEDPEVTEGEVRSIRDAPSAA